MTPRLNADFLAADVDTRFRKLERGQFEATAAARQQPYLPKTPRPNTPGRLAVGRPSPPLPQGWGALR